MRAPAPLYCCSHPSLPPRCELWGDGPCPRRLARGPAKTRCLQGRTGRLSPPRWTVSTRTSGFLGQAPVSVCLYLGAFSGRGGVSGQLRGRPEVLVTSLLQDRPSASAERSLSSAPPADITGSRILRHRPRGPERDRTSDAVETLHGVCWPLSRGGRPRGAARRRPALIPGPVKTLRYRAVGLCRLDYPL